MQLDEYQINRLNVTGHVIIDNFLPQPLYKALLHELKMGKSEQVLQIKQSHYEHVFKSDNQFLPQAGETYLAKFSLIKGGVNQETFFKEHIVPLMKQVKPVTYAISPNAVKLKSGDLYRAHHDEYAGSVGYSFFLNDGWCADYGGILTYVKWDTLEPIYPLANRLLLRNETLKEFHFLNSVEQFCTKEQYIVLGWADTKSGENSKIRGEYRRI